MLPARSSTPRPRQVDMGHPSFVDYNKESSTSSESRWTVLTDTMEGNGRETACTEPPPVDARPRKRRRVTSGDSVATQTDLSTTHSDQHRYFPNTTHKHSGRTAQLLDSCLDTGSHEMCHTCRKCKSNHLCSRCRTPTCSICTRTCTIAAMSAPPTPLLCFSATPSPRPNSSRLPADDSSDIFESVDVDELWTRLSLSTNLPAASKRRVSSSPSTFTSRKIGADNNDALWREGPSSGGCGRVVCQACAVEDFDSHESTCLDCLDGLGLSSSAHRSSD